MMSLGQRLIASAKQARAYVNGEDNGCVVYIPYEIDTARIRQGMSMSQEQFALHFGLDLSIVQDWETGRVVPTGPARVLIRVIDVNPEAVRCALIPTK
jgi:putative transcriptional regulator